MEIHYINIKDKIVLLNIREYKNSNKINIYIKRDTLNVSKPIQMSLNEVMRIIKANEDLIYEVYIKKLNTQKSLSKRWLNGEQLMYEGQILDIVINEIDTNRLSLVLDDKVYISIPKNLTDENKKYGIDRIIKRVFKNNTTVLLNEKLPEISKKIGIPYSSFIVRDAFTRFGSCVPLTRELRFSSRLIMLPSNIVDSIIVHELCHIKVPNHSKDFYNLVNKSFLNYQECEKWLKDNGKYILF